MRAKWFKEMVVERPGARPRDIAPVAAPPVRPSPGRGVRRRVVVDYGYRDSFHLLYEGGAFSQAAE